ncbi:serine incorporator 3, partial [Olea europaea subsp. europaea]
MIIILPFAFIIIALHMRLFNLQQVNGSLLPASVVSAYCAYLCYTGLSSEYRGYECNGFHKKSKVVSTSTFVLGMLTIVLSVLYSALRVQSATTFLTPSWNETFSTVDDSKSGKQKKEAKARFVSHSYTFFHLIFALASMYSAMLLSGWTSSNERSWYIDVEWTLVWVQFCTEWVTAALYVWSLVAQLIFPDCEFY